MYIYEFDHLGGNCWKRRAKTNFIEVQPCYVGLWATYAQPLPMCNAGLVWKQTLMEYLFLFIFFSTNLYKNECDGNRLLIFDYANWGHNMLYYYQNSLSLSSNSWKSKEKIWFFEFQNGQKKNRTHICNYSATWVGEEDKAVGWGLG